MSLILSFVELQQVAMTVQKKADVAIGNSSLTVNTLQALLYYIT